VNLRRRVAIGGVMVLSGLGLAWALQPPPPPEWDWIGLEEDLDLLDSLPVDGQEAWRERSDDLVEELAAVDALPRRELERHLPSVARLLAVAGLAAERSGSVDWPRFGRVDGQRINVSWYRAARLVRAHPELGAVVEDEARAAIDVYVAAMASGELPATDRIAPP
jgi:hypothetical protein